MPDESAFIDAIRTHPRDFALRLVYADWLDEAGDPRGELIRVQCALYNLPLDDPHRHVLFEHRRDLVAQHGSAWLLPLRKRVLGWQSARIYFGLVEHVHVSPTAFLKHSDEGLFDEMPHLVGVWLQGSEKPLCKALESPHVERLTSLRVSVLGPSVPGRIVELLASTPAVRFLTTLDLCDGRFGDDAVARLLNAPHLQQLETLNLQNNDLTSRFAEALAESPLLPRLSSLALGSPWPWGRNRIGDAGVRRLSGVPSPLTLSSLDLTHNNLSDSSAWDLARSSSFPRLKCLHLGGNKLGRTSRHALEARFPKRVRYVEEPPEWDGR